MSLDTAPSNVRVFMNKPNLAFDEAEDTPSTQDFCLSEVDNNLSGGAQLVPLKFVKFQNVTSLQLFVMENIGGDEMTEIRGLEVFGSTGEKSDISDWKPVKG